MGRRLAGTKPLPPSVIDLHIIRHRSTVPADCGGIFVGHGKAIHNAH